MKKFITVLLLLVVALGVVGCGVTKKAEPKTEANVEVMSGEKLEEIQNDNKKKDKLLLIDARPNENYREGHVKHAVNLTVEDVNNRIEELKFYKDFPILVYCNTDKKSGEVVKILKDNDFKDVGLAQGVKQYEYKNLVTYSNILHSDLIAKIDDANTALIDVRPSEDYEKGHIKGAINVPFDKVEENLDKIPTDKDIITYCFSGNKSAEVAEVLVEKGFANVSNTLEGTKEYEYDLVKD